MTSRNLHLQPQDTRSNDMDRRRTGVAASAVLLALSLAACNRGESAAGGGGGEGGGCSGLRVGPAVANLQADFFNQIKQSLDAEAAELGMEVQVSDAGGDSAT